MASMDDYDYSGMSHFIEEFQNPFTDRPFISEMEENYGSLWQFKDCVVGWNLGVSRYKGYTHLLHKDSNSPTFLPLNVLEKVILIEQFHARYIVIRIQEVNADGVELEHVHSIVVNVGDESAQFDVEGMLTNLSNTAQEELADLLRSMYSPWTAMDAESENRWLNRILQSLTRYLARLTQSTPIATPTAIPPVAASGVTASGSRTQASNNRSTARLPGRASPRVRSWIEGEQPESSRKRWRASIGAGSSGSGMTHEDNQGRGDAEEVPDYEKFTAIQKDFWDTCTSSFVFGMQSFKVDIAQCMITKDEYIIWKMEAEIMKNVKAELLQMGDINQCQKICLTSVDVQGNLLRTKPKDWNEIKNNKFMIINGQHNI
jgi:hypothetical protein